MFEMEGDPAFAFVDPMIAAAIAQSDAAPERWPGLYAELLFCGGEAGEMSDADEIFDV